MQGINKQIIVGNVGGEVKFKEGNTSVLKFSVAVNEKWGDNEHTEWFNVVVFGKFAESLERHIEKGMLVYVEGSTNTQEYEDKDGKKQRWTEVKVDTLRMLSGGKDRDDRRDDRGDRGGRRDDRRDDRDRGGDRGRSRDDDRRSDNRDSRDGGSRGDNRRSDNNPWGDR